MIFESLWPLFFLAAVPVIIILYLLKPKGVDHLISSNLLWQKLLKNQQSKTFFEKFVHNILMYVQILIIALLVIALMSPFIHVTGQNGGRKILLIDKSGSMQHVGALGKSRLEEATELASEYIRASQNTKFSLVTVDASGAELLAVDSTDTDGLVAILKGLECSDGGGSLAAAQGVIDTLTGTEAEDGADLIVYTDGAGAADFEQLHNMTESSLQVVGEPGANVANEYTVFTLREDGLYDVMVSMTNYSGQRASFDVSLYDGDESLMALSQMSLEPAETQISLFEAVEWEGQSISSKISGIQFADGKKDSLAADNISMAVKKRGNLINGLLVGEGNIFLEKAYKAVTGTDIVKAASDVAAEGDSVNVVLYDVGQEPEIVAHNGLLFGNVHNGAVETLENVVLDMTDCDLTTGLSGFTIGVNKAYCFDLPKGAESFLEYNGKCVGYYVEFPDHKEVVVGFDIRETDFPLRAEFPVFLANAMIYLSDTSWLASNVYYAGEEIALQPWAEVEEAKIDSRLMKAGLYSIGNEEYQESYVVRFQTATESDGQAVAESVSDTGAVTLQQVRQTLRNVFLVLVLILLIIEWIIYVRQMRYQGKFYLVVRGVVLLCVLLALFGIKIRLGGNQTATIFVVDISNSNEEHLEEMEEYLRKKVEAMPSGNNYGIVCFGKNNLVEQFLTSEKRYGGLMTVPEKTATNFEDAISRALTMIPGGASGRIVLLTDGKETSGDIQHMAGVITAARTEFLTLLYEDVVTSDAYIENVTLPTYLHPGDKYSVNVQVESNFDTDAIIELYNGSEKVAENAVHLNKGSNRFAFSRQVAEEITANATENLRAVVKAEGDTCEENNAYSAYSVVESAPRVLVIAGQDTEASHFTTVLNAAGCDYSVLSTLNAPEDINAMLEYKSIILVDTYIDDLPKGFLDNLETYVKDYGCGFVCCGGEDSFALGGYRDTVLETVLPVDMEMRNVNEMPSMAMVMVIDRSSSMSGSMNNNGGATSLDVAIRAATVAVDNLRDSDYVGVLTFDDGYSWQVDIVQAKDREAIKNAITGIDMGGGTTIKPALEEAYRALLNSEVSVKHVVLLTDGMGETSDFNDVIQNYLDAGITLSTVAVGTGSDTKLLEKLANSCGGRYYYSDIASDIPKIFAQEVFLGGDSYIQNGDFGLSVWSGHELTKGLFAEGWPNIYGYISASPKTASSSIITTGEKDDPILTVWQYGLGRTVAWNSDVTGEWSGPFAGKEDYVQLWKRIVDYSTGNADLGEDRVNVVSVGESSRIVYETEDYDGDTRIVATMIDPEGNAQEVVLHATEPGKYETDVATPQTGLYHYNIRRMKGDEIQSYITTASAVQFSYEYKFDISTDAYMNFVNQYGRVITPEEEIWTKLDTGAGEKRSLTNFLLGLAIVLFLADVAMRRFQYVPVWKGMHRKNAVDKSKESVDVSGGISGGSAGGFGENVGATGEAAMVESRREDSKEAKSAEGTKQEKKAKKPKPAKPKKQKEAEATLDTSQLLKKKDNRNI